MRTIRLTDGTEYAVTYCGTADGLLFFEIQDAEGGLLQAARPFGDPKLTETVVLEADELRPTAFRVFTRLMGVQRDRFRGYMTVNLAKEE